VSFSKEFMKHLSTPWDVADYVKPLSTNGDVIRVGTPGHGGIGVKRTLAMPKHLASVAILDSKWRWFEEDLDWACVAIAFPELFNAKSIEAANATLLAWLPDVYEKHYGRKPTAEESHEIRERELREKHKSNYRVQSATGDWAYNVPLGQVYVVGHRESDNSTAGFLVPHAEYKGYSTLVLDNYPRFEPDKSLPYSKPLPGAVAA
jgi:hypothetical protein